MDCEWTHLNRPMGATDETRHPEPVAPMEPYYNSEDAPDVGITGGGC